MNIRRIAINEVSEIIEIEIVHMDYKGQVAKRINEKMPLATVKGFRKGAVPKDLVIKQYGKAIKIEEVKKEVEAGLERYITNERLNLLGTPLAIEKEIFNWDMEDLTFQYEIGLVPNFELNLDAPTDIIKYKVYADEKMVDEQVLRIQKQFGKPVPQDEVTEISEIDGTFTNEAAGINNQTFISLNLFKDKSTADKFIGKKVGDVITLNTKGLFNDDHQLMDYLKVDHDGLHDLDIDVDFTIEIINNIELAELNQELFDKLFPAGDVANLDNLKAKIKEDAEKHFAQQADEKLKRDVEDFHIKNTKFDLPKDFLIRWLQTVGEKQLTPAEAEIEYARSEPALRFQLIEGKAMAQSDIKVSFEDLKTFTMQNIRSQMAQFGQQNATDQEVESIVARVLSNQDEVKRLSNMVVKEKMLLSLIEKANPTTKDVTYDQFVAAMYGE
jgi:trigger factor